MVTLTEARKYFGDRLEDRESHRQTGRTTRALTEAKNLAPAALVIVPNEMMRRNTHALAMKHGLGPRFPIMVANQVPERVRGRHDKVWYVDCYSHLDDRTLGAIFEAAVFGTDRLVLIP